MTEWVKKGKKNATQHFGKIHSKGSDHDKTTERSVGRIYFLYIPHSVHPTVYVLIWFSLAKEISLYK